MNKEFCCEQRHVALSVRLMCHFMLVRNSCIHVTDYDRCFMYHWYVAGLKDLDRSLGAYPYDSLKKWVSLTNHITEDLVAR